MKCLVWLDVLTPKQARLLASIAQRLERKGYSVFMTSRKYDYTLSVLRDLYGVEPVVVGGHGSTKLEKLVLDAERVRELALLVGERKPDVLVAYPSPSAARVAYGLSLDMVILTDSPHIEPVHRLVLPLADTVLVSRYIAEQVEKYVLKEFTILETYNGVDEVEYLKEATPSLQSIKSLELEEYSYIVVRPPEYKASYYPRGEWLGVLEDVALKLVSKGVKIVYFPRYAEQAKLMKNKRGVIVPNRAHDSISLYYYALAVVTGGISMAREAALLGTPAFTIFHRVLDVDRFLMSKGVPLFYVNDVSKLYEQLVGLLGSRTMREEMREKALKILSEMERPSSRLLEILGRLCGK